MERDTEDSERAANQNNLKELYLKMKLLSGCLKKPSTGKPTKKMIKSSPQRKCLKGGRAFL